MKILIDARTLGTRPSGIGMYLYHFAKALASVPSVQLILASDVSQSEQLHNLEQQCHIPVRIYGKAVNKSLSVWQYGAFLQRLIAEERPDIFWEVNNLLPMKIKNPYGKYIVTIHDVFPVTIPEQFGKIYPLYFRYGVKKTLRCCDGVLYNSTETRNQTEHHFPRAKRKTHYIGHIIVSPIASAKIPRKDEFLYTGNLEKRKGTDILLSAYQEYLARGGTWPLYLAGKIRETDIAGQIKEISQQTEKLQYLGYLSEKEKSRRYQECGCFVFPSRAEGFGIPVVEALSCGADVLASRLPIFEELVGDAVTYFDLDGQHDAQALADAMLRFTPSEESARIAKQQVAARYSDEALLPGLLAFFETIIKT